MSKRTPSPQTRLKVSLPLDAQAKFDRLVKTHGRHRAASLLGCDIVMIDRLLYGGQALKPAVDRVVEALRMQAGAA